MDRAAFSAAKSGLASLTKSLALEVAEYGITANMVCPGDIVGDMKESDIIKARLLEDKETPVGRSGTGEDIARIIEFLCDENSDMITGSIISASGGVDVVHKAKTSPWQIMQGLVRYSSDSPPSINISLPVICLDASEAKKEIKSATSSGLAERLASG